MSSAYILLLLSYLRVNMNRNTDKPLCCYRLYQKITEDIGLSERYISRIIKILDVMDIIKYQEGELANEIQRQLEILETKQKQL